MATEEDLQGTVKFLTDELVGLRGYVERLAIASERATNVAEVASERTLQALASFSQIEAALKIAMMATSQIRELEEKNSKAQKELRQIIDGMRVELTEMRSEIFVALGRSATAEEVALEAKKAAFTASRNAEQAQKLKSVADEARAVSFKAIKESQNIGRELAKVAETVEEHDERLDQTTDKRLAELEELRRRSESDWRAQAQEAQEILKQREEKRQAAEEQERLAKLEREKLEAEAKKEATKAKWAIAGRVLAPTVLVGLISLLVTLAGRC